MINFLVICGVFIFKEKVRNSFRHSLLHLLYSGENLKMDEEQLFEMDISDETSEQSSLCSLLDFENDESQNQMDIDFSEENADISALVNFSLDLDAAVNLRLYHDIDLSSIGGRVKTFHQRWSPLMSISAQSLAENGFYFWHYPDTVKCYYCSLVMNFNAPSEEKTLTELHYIASKQATHGCICPFVEDLYLWEIVTNLEQLFGDENEKKSSTPTSNQKVEVDVFPSWEFVDAAGTTTARVNDGTIRLGAEGRRTSSNSGGGSSNVAGSLGVGTVRKQSRLGRRLFALGGGDGGDNGGDSGRLHPIAEEQQLANLLVHSGQGGGEGGQGQGGVERSGKNTTTAGNVQVGGEERRGMTQRNHLHHLNLLPTGVSGGTNAGVAGASHGIGPSSSAGLQLQQSIG